MRSLFLLIAGLLVACNAVSTNKKVVCYYNSWAIYRLGQGQMTPSEIPSSLCTHVIYNIAGITENANLRVIDPNADLPVGKNGFNVVNALRRENPTLKTLIAVVGSKYSQSFSRIAADASLRQKFVDNAVAFVERYGFNGLDLQWSYPTYTDRHNFVQLLKQLKKQFAAKNLILSALLMGVQSSTAFYDVPEVVKYLDFANIITFDLHGSWDRVTGINSPLYAGSWEYGWSKNLNVDAIVTNWLSQGVSANKLVISIPTYGRSFTLDDVQESGIGASASQPGYPGPYTRTDGLLGYNEICEEIENGSWKYVFEREQRVPYIVRHNQWVGYENPQSVTEKVQYIRNHELGGVAVYSLDTDDFHGTCGYNYQLLKVINNGLKK